MSGLSGLPLGQNLNLSRIAGAVALCLCLLFAAGTPSRSQETPQLSETVDGAPGFTTFEAPGAGAGQFQGTAAIAINAAGTVVGLYVDSSGAFHGYVRTPSGVFTSFMAKDAGTGANQGTIPFSINASGVIAGMYLNGKS